MTTLLSDALLELAERGYVRSLRLRGSQLWCSSCELTISVEEFLLETNVEVVGPGNSPEGTLCALYCPRHELRATWLVQAGEAAEARVLSLLRHRERECRPVSAPGR
jgi:hypothetical protein